MAQQQTPRQVAERATESVEMPRTGPMLLGVFGNETAPEETHGRLLGTLAHQAAVDRRLHLGRKAE